MCNSAILERVKFLQTQITRIHAANQIYLGKQSPTDVEAHQRREERLHDILDELARLNGKMKAA